MDTAIDQLKIAIDLYKYGVGEVNVLWNVFSVVVVAMVGVIFGGKAEINRQIKMALLIAFLFFAIGNHIALKKAQDVCVSAAKTINGYVPSKDTKGNVMLQPGFKVMLEGIDPTETFWVEIFHIGLSLITFSAFFIAKAKETTIKAPLAEE